MQMVPLTILKDSFTKKKNLNRNDRLTYTAFDKRIVELTFRSNTEEILMLAPSRKERFDSNEEVIAKVEAYFESKDKLIYQKGIKKLEERWAECIIPEEEFLEK
ncbi:hypothetical protein TNCV_2993471 [Trichonephila clavipes]|nr:hypothetical protein TNCV_2993471 [Trichonephila clavipes]